MEKWCILTPPDGASRQITSFIVKAFQDKLPPNSYHLFDCKKYYAAFASILQHPKNELVVDLLNQSLIVQCFQYKVSYIFIPALCPITLFTLTILKEHGIVTIHWFFEDYRRATYWQDIITGYRWFFTVQKGFMQEIVKKYSCKVAYLPTAMDEPSPYIKSNQSKYVDVAFIGFPSSYRVTILEFLAHNNVTLAIAGEGWDKYKGILEKSIIVPHWTEASISAQIIQSAFAALNLSYHEPTGNLWDIQLSPRIFTILSLKTILITEDVPLLHETLEGGEFNTFKSKEEVLQILRNLQLPESTEKWKRQISINYSIIKEQHTWFKRIEKILSLCASSDLYCSS